jgi:hypothetical protein
MPPSIALPDAAFDAKRDRFFAKLFLLGRNLRVCGRGDASIVADASDSPQGEPSYVKMVEAGRIVCRESFYDQAARADRTWGR